MPGTSDRITRAAVEKEKKRKAEQERKEREAKRFAPTKIIGRNDIAVNQELVKIKIEQPEVKVEQDVVIVKEEVELVEDSGGGFEGTPPEGNGTEDMANISQEVSVEAIPICETESIADFEVKQETGSYVASDRSDIDMNQEELNVEQIIKHENEQGDSFEDLHKNCHKETEDLRNENLLLKQKVQEYQLQMKQMELQIQQLQKKTATENNPTVVAGKVLPILICRGGHFNYENFLKCRRVCKDWQREVDTFLENAVGAPRPFCKIQSQVEIRRSKLEALPTEYHLGKLGDKYKFNYASTMERFLNLAENFGPNPFIGRCVSFHPRRLNPRNPEDPLPNWIVPWGKPKHKLNPETDALEWERYWELVTELLSKFGEHLFGVIIHQQHVMNLTPTQLYKILERCLPLLPNLQFLSLRGTFYACAIYEESYKSAKIAELTEYMEGNSLPSLPNLRILDFRFDTDFEIKTAILKVSPSVTKLISKAMSDESAEYIGKLAVKEIRLLSTRPRDYMRLNSLPKDMENLEFNFKYYYDGLDMSGLTKLGITQLVSVLNRFPKLCHLELTGTIFLDLEEQQNEQKPTVQNLSLENLKLCCCYEDNRNRKQVGIVKDLFQCEGYYRKLASHFPNLRFLIIEDERHVNYGMRCVEATTSSDIVYGSDIWTGLKKLELVSVNSTYGYSRVKSEKDLCWTREKYRDFQKRQAVTEN